MMASGLGVIGCNGKDNPRGNPDGGQRADGGGPGTDGGNPDGGMNVELTAFAKDLILNHSADPLPTTTEDKTFAPDTMDASIFPSSFFP